jgi:uncharacterized protein (TIGR03435 family)
VTRYHIVAAAIAVILGVTNAPLLRAQADPSLRFEVAAVRRVEIPSDGRGVPVFPPIGGIGTSDPRHISYHGAQMVPLIAETFGVRGDQITAPASIHKDRYDIVANIPEGATKEQFNVMMGNLLRDRFHLRFHIESKVIPVYALRVGKNGPKFKETARRAGGPATPSRGGRGFDALGFPILPPDYTGVMGMPRPGEMFWAAQDVPMAQLAQLIESPVVGRPIVDETGLTGHYDFKIHYHWRDTRPEPIPDPAPSVFTAVQEQLGLKLEPSAAPFNHLTIDSIDREPTDN